MPADSGESAEMAALLGLIRKGLEVESAAVEAFTNALETFVLTEGIDAVMATLGSGLVDDQVRAAILTLNMGEVVDILTEAGIDDVWETTAIKALPELRRLSVQMLEAAGVSRAFALLDTEGMASTLGALEDFIDVDTWARGIVSPTAGKIIDGLGSTLRLERIEDIAAALRGQGFDWHHAATEARDGLAYYGNFVNDALIDAADPEGEDLLVAYLGPDDRLTRPFCDVLVGKAFTQTELDKANNGVKGRPFRHNHGGYRCRHRLVGVTNDPEVLAALGLERGTPADVSRANAAARGKGKGRR